MAIKAEIQLDNKQFLASAKEVEKATDSMMRYAKLPGVGTGGGASSGGGISAASVSSSLSRFAALATGGAIVHGFASIVEEGDRIGDLAQRFGIAAGGLQRIGFAAGQNEGDLDSVAMAMNKLVIAQDKIRAGDKGKTDSLAALGIDAEKFINLSTEDAFYALADGVKNADDRTAAYAAVIDILGKSAGNLFTTLEMGSSGIKALTEGIAIYSDESLEQFDRIDKGWKGLMQTMKAGAASAFTSILDGFVKVTGVVGNKLGLVSDSTLQALADMQNEREDGGKVTADDHTRKRINDEASAAKDAEKDKAKALELEAKALQIERDRSKIAETDPQKRARLAGDISAKGFFIEREDQLKASGGRRNVSDVDLATRKVELQKQMSELATLDAKMAEDAAKKEKSRIEFESGFRRDSGRLRAVAAGDEMGASFYEQQAAYEKHLKDAKAAGVENPEAFAAQRTSEEGLAKMAGKKPGATAGGRSITTDSLARVAGGGFFGGGSNQTPELREAQRQTRLLERIEQKIEPKPSDKPAVVMVGLG